MRTAPYSDRSCYHDIRIAYCGDVRIICNRFPAGTSDCHYIQGILTGPGVHLADSSVVGKAFTPGVKRPGREADRRHLVPRLRMKGAVPILRHMPSWSAQQLCLSVSGFGKSCRLDQSE
jgi:hypothetical protein